MSAFANFVGLCTNIAVGKPYKNDITTVRELRR